jgi:hypothetical protein
MNLAPAAIRKINQTRTIHFDYPGHLVVEPSVMLGHGRIVSSGLAQFVR